MQPTHYGYESFASSFLLPCKKLIGIFDLRLRCNVFDIVSVVLVKIIFFYVCVLILFFLRLIGVDECECNNISKCYLKKGIISILSFGGAVS